VHIYIITVIIYFTLHTNIPKTWVRPKQAAEFLGVSTQTLKHWADRGYVPCTRNENGHRYFDPDVLEEIWLVLTVTDDEFEQMLKITA